MTLFDETVEILDKNKVTRIRLGLDKNGNPFFSLNDSVGRERLIMSVADDGNASLGFREANGQPTVTLGVSSVLGRGMMILDVKNETCMTLGIAQGHGEVRLAAKDFTCSWPAQDV